MMKLGEEPERHYRALSARSHSLGLPALPFSGYYTPSRVTGPGASTQPARGEHQARTVTQQVDNEPITPVWCPVNTEISNHPTTTAPHGSHGAPARGLGLLQTSVSPLGKWGPSSWSLGLALLPGRKPHHIRCPFRLGPSGGPTLGATPAAEEGGARKSGRGGAHPQPRARRRRGRRLPQKRAPDARGAASIPGR